MKTFFLALVASLAAVSAYSQTSTQSQEWQIRRDLLEGRNRDLITMRTEPADEIRNGRFSYNGIFVQMSKTPNPLQLINPMVPPEYGSGWQNVIVDELGEPPSSAARAGLKLFSINF